MLLASSLAVRCWVREGDTEPDTPQEQLQGASVGRWAVQGVYVTQVFTYPTLLFLCEGHP